MVKGKERWLGVLTGPRVFCKCFGGRTGPGARALDRNPYHLEAYQFTPSSISNGEIIQTFIFQQKLKLGFSPGSSVPS